MKNNQAFFQFLLAITGLFITFSSHAFVPSVKNYSAKSYSSHQINYDVIFTESGLLYAANAYGVLEFNGSTWSKTPLPGGKSPIALCKNDTGTIFISGDHEFGYLTKNDKGENKYHSLIHLISEEEQKNIGWMMNCVSHDGKIYFQSQKAIYVYDGKEVKIKKPEEAGKYLFVGTERDLLYVMEYGKGIGVIQKDLTVEWLEGDLEALEIRGLQKMDNGKFYFFGRHHIWEYKDGVAEAMEVEGVGKEEVFSDYSTSGKYRVLSTEQHGTYVYDEDFKLIYHITKESNGCLSNYVLAVAQNEAGDLAIASSNGITTVPLSSPVLRLNPERKVDGAGYASLRVGDGIYLGTGQGLYYASDWKQLNFEQIKGVKGIIYDIHLQDGKVFFGDHSDFYMLDELQNPIKISPSSWRGSWTIKSVPNRKDILLVGTYEGIDVYRKIDGKWQFSNVLEGYNAAGRTIELDKDGSIWVASGLQGFFHLYPEKDFSKVGNSINFCNKMKVDNDFFIEVVKQENTIYVSSYNGIYRVNDNVLIKENRFDPRLKFERIRSIGKDQLYTVEQHNPIYIKLIEDEFVIDSTHILNNIEVDMIGSSEYIDEIAPGLYLVGTSEGFILADNSKPKNYMGEVKLSAVRTMKNDSLISLGASALPYKFNSLSLRFSYSALENFYNIKWYTSVNGSPWSLVQTKSNFKEIANLSEGVYELKIKATSRYQVIGEKTIRFEILPPWYRSGMAKGLYVVLFFVALGLGYIAWKKRLQKEQEKLKKEKEKELEVQKKYYQAELLKTELQKKETKMSYLSLAHTQKKDLLSYVSNKLDKILDIADNPVDVRKAVVSLRTSLNQKSTVKEEKDWKEFQLHFDKSNKNFIEKLKKIDPKIKESFILMCVYIRMGKSNKEIANLLNISLNTLDKRKWRLKNKYPIPEEQSLNEYLKEL